MVIFLAVFGHLMSTKALIMCTCVFPGSQQAGDAVLAAAVAAEALGVQQHTRFWSERQLELPDPGLPSHWPRGQRQW